MDTPSANPVRLTLPHVIDSAGAIDMAWHRVRPRLERLACLLTPDQDLRADMLQEALILFWRRDPTRYELRDLEDYQFVIAMLANRMRRVYWVERCHQARRVN